MDHTLITKNAIPLVKYFRANGHATTPIVLAEGTPSGTDWAAPDVSSTQQGANAIALAAAFKSLIAEGDTHLYYAKSADLFADPLGMTAVNPATDDPTVGGCHLSDLGMRKQAKQQNHRSLLPCPHISNLLSPVCCKFYCCYHRPLPLMPLPLRRSGLRCCLLPVLIAARAGGVLGDSNPDVHGTEPPDLGTERRAGSPSPVADHRDTTDSGAD
jgi:hypothetical protein